MSEVKVWGLKRPAQAEGTVCALDPMLARHYLLGTKCLAQWLPSHEKKL